MNGIGNSPENFSNHGANSPELSSVDVSTERIVSPNYENMHSYESTSPNQIIFQEHARRYLEDILSTNPESLDSNMETYTAYIGALRQIIHDKLASQIIESKYQIPEDWHFENFDLDYDEVKAEENYLIESPFVGSIQINNQGVVINGYDFIIETDLLNFYTYLGCLNPNIDAINDFREYLSFFKTSDIKKLFNASLTEAVYKKYRVDISGSLIGSIQFAGPDRNSKNTAINSISDLQMMQSLAGNNKLDIDTDTSTQWSELNDPALIIMGEFIYIGPVSSTDQDMKSSVEEIKMTNPVIRMTGNGLELIGNTQEGIKSYVISLQNIINTMSDNPSNRYMLQINDINFSNHDLYSDLANNNSDLVTNVITDFASNISSMMVPILGISNSNSNPNELVRIVESSSIKIGEIDGKPVVFRNQQKLAKDADSIKRKFYRL